MGNENFYKTLTCSHCGNISNMIDVGKFEDQDVYDDEEEERYGGGSGTTYVGLKCHACSKVNIVSYYWHPGMEDNEVDLSFDYLYPSNKDYPKGLPPKILNAFINAEKVKIIDVHLYATAIRRLLEQVCYDKGAKKAVLNEMLKDLSLKNIIPPSLVEVAAGLKDFGNIGAHAGDVELSEKEIPIVTDLCNAVLEYIYSAPHLADVAQKALSRIKGKRLK